MALSYSTTLRNAMLDAITTAVGNGAKIRDRISSLLDVLAAYWDAMDRGYGPSQNIFR